MDGDIGPAVEPRDGCARGRAGRWWSGRHRPPGDLPRRPPYTRLGTLARAPCRLVMARPDRAPQAACRRFGAAPRRRLPTFRPRAYRLPALNRSELPAVRVRSTARRRPVPTHLSKPTLPLRRRSTRTRKGRHAVLATLTSAVTRSSSATPVTCEQPSSRRTVAIQRPGCMQPDPLASPPRAAFAVDSAGGCGIGGTSHPLLLSLHSRRDVAPTRSGTATGVDQRPRSGQATLGSSARRAALASQRSRTAAKS